MSNRVGDYVREARKKRGLSIAELARLAGYRNISKSVRRIELLEQEGIIHWENYAKIAAALRVDDATIGPLAEADRRDLLEAWEKWADEPVPVKIIVRLIPAVYPR